MIECKWPHCQLYGYAFDLMNNGKPYACPLLTGRECKDSDYYKECREKEKKGEPV